MGSGFDLAFEALTFSFVFQVAQQQWKVENQRLQLQRILESKEKQRAGEIRQHSGFEALMTRILFFRWPKAPWLHLAM